MFTLRMNLIVTNNIGEHTESCVSLDCGQGVMTKKKEKKIQVIHISWDIQSKIYPLPYHSRSFENGMKLNLLGEEKEF